MTGQLLYAFQVDVARQIHSPEEIAQRYHFDDAKHAHEYIRAHPKIAKQIKDLRSIWESELSLREKTQVKALHALDEALIETAQIMFDRSAHPRDRIDALKAHAAIAGFNPSGRSGDGNGGGGSGGAPFSVQIVFQGSGKVEQFKVAPTIDAETGEKTEDRLVVESVK